jgi:hypothetical protein
MIIPLQFEFSQFISFREEDLWNFSQSEHIIGPGSHIEYPTGTKNSNFVEDHPRNIPAKIGSNRQTGTYVRDGFLENKREWMYFLVHLDQRSMWTIAITWRPSSVVCSLSSVVCKLFTFQASSPKPLGRLEPNLAGMFLGPSWISDRHKKQ